VRVDRVRAYKNHHFLKGPELLAARVRPPEWWAQLRAWWGKFLPTTAGWFLGLALELGADAL
jgi:hypothetical protein